MKSKTSHQSNENFVLQTHFSFASLSSEYFNIFMTKIPGGIFSQKYRQLRVREIPFFPGDSTVSNECAMEGTGNDNGINVLAKRNLGRNTGPCLTVSLGNFRHYQPYKPLKRENRVKLYGERTQVNEVPGFFMTEGSSCFYNSKKR